MSPRPGDFGVLVLETGRHWRTEFVISAISLITRSSAYHAVQCVDAPGGHPSLVEAEPGGAILSPVTKYTNVAWSNLTLGDPQREAISTAALKMVGRPYGYYDDALLGLTHLNSVRGPNWLWRLLSGSHSPLECAQLVDAAQLAGGVHLFSDGRQPGDVTPGDLYQLIRKGKS